MAVVLVASGRDGGPARTAPARSQVEHALRRPVGAIGPADVQAMGPGAEAVLQQIAADKRAGTELRARAIDALSFTRSASARRFLEQIVEQTGRSGDASQLLLLRRAVVALGWLAGPNTVELLIELLDHPEPSVRRDVVLALGLTRSPEAGTALRARLPDEPDAEVRAQITRQLSVLQKGGPTAP